MTEKTERKCPECGGTGWVPQEVKEGSLAITCSACHGTGERKTGLG